MGPKWGAGGPGRGGDPTLHRFGAERVGGGDPDTDGGRYDNDTVWDRAVGPMQFIPATWEAVAPQATGKSDPGPQNIFDATRATVAYLCQPHQGQEEVDLRDQATLERSLMRYNNSQVYVDTVMGHIKEYDAIPVSLGAMASGAAAVAIDWASQHVGSPYVWGASARTPSRHSRARAAPPPHRTARTTATAQV